MSLRVLIADDQTLMRSGLRMILDVPGEIEVVGEAVDGAQAVALTRQLRPDVVLMDVRMPKLDGIEATRLLTADPGVRSKILMLTTYDVDEYVYEALVAGASGFLLKTAPPEQLLQGVCGAAAGDALLAPSITRRLIDEFVLRPPPGDHLPSRLSGLTERETEVLVLVARGLSNAEIGRALFLGEATVKTHINRILRKLNLRDRVQAVVLAYECGLVRPGEVATE